MSYYYFKPTKAKEVEDGIKARSKRGAFASSWWAKRWIAALERLVDSGRLGHGRSYARKGQVISIDEKKDGILAKVQGLRSTPYKVTIKIASLSDSQWDAVIDAFAEQAIFTAQLLAGEMPQDIEGTFKEAGASLFPEKRGDLETDCSCPDWANPCKHVAAAHYILGERFDEDPFLIFRLRGRTQEEVMSALRERRAGEDDFAEEEVEEEIIPPLEESLSTFLSLVRHWTHFLCVYRILPSKHPCSNVWGRQTLCQNPASKRFCRMLMPASARRRSRWRMGRKGPTVAELHIRASQWYEDNDLEIEAFEHAAAANDIERAERLMEGDGMPLQFCGAMTPVLNWLESLPAEIMDASPSLWVTYASTLTMIGKPVDRIEEVLQSAEAALQHAEPDEKNRDLIGHIAAIRAMLAIPQNQVETIIDQSRRALEYLSPENLSVRTTTTWTLGYAYQLQGDRASATQAHTEALKISQTSGNIMISIAAATSLGQIQESENQLHQAAESYRRVLDLAGDPPLPAASEAYLGLGRIFYEWNDLDAAQEHGEKSLQLARKMENIDTPASCELLFARLKLARGDMKGASENIASAEQFVGQNNFGHRMPDVVAAQVLVSLRQGDIARAVELAHKHKLPTSQARVHLAQGDASAALALLESYRRQAETKAWDDERLKAMILQAVAYYAHDKGKQALGELKEALELAEPGGFIRIFVDEGLPMADLLFKAAAQGIMPDYISKLLAAVEAEGKSGDKSSQSLPQPIIEPLSERELEILQLIAQGLSNREISERLFLALNTVKGYNRKIFNKLQVQRRTEAVARARELNLL